MGSIGYWDQIYLTWEAPNYHFLPNVSLVVRLLKSIDYRNQFLSQSDPIKQSPLYKVVGWGRNSGRPLGKIGRLERARQSNPEPKRAGATL